MPHTEFFTLKSAADGLDLSMMMVCPDGEVRALVQLAHGMTEHKERYDPFMNALAQHGYLCVMNDHRGHGASVRCRDDLGYFYDRGDEALVEDLHQISIWMREKWPGRKLFLFGHSMGSLAVRAYCEKYDRDIDSLVVCGSPGMNAAAGAGLFLIRLLTMMHGERYRSALMQKMTVGAFARKFPEEGHPCAWISANMENVAEYEKDPLCRFAFTLNGNRALLRLMQRAYALKKPRGNPDLPVYFFSGANDACAPDEKGFYKAVENMRAAGYCNVQGYMFPGMRHEILREMDCKAVFEKIRTEAFEPYI